jgi:hypothetical protein
MAKVHRLDAKGLFVWGALLGRSSMYHMDWHPLSTGAGSSWVQSIVVTISPSRYSKFEFRTRLSTSMILIPAV